ncbi:MAG TPA: amino acid--[acyl-carrier-protein] ligase [Vicinamibacterales bacterium]
MSQAFVAAPGAGRRPFLDGLVEHGLLVPSAVPGVYGRGAQFERVLVAFDDLVARETAPDGAELVRFPPTLPRRQLEQSGYLKSFPHLAGTVFTFAGGEREAVELAELSERHESWSHLQASSDLTLQPAACYPVYPMVATAGALPEGGRLVDVQGWCYRSEPSDDPARMQAFRMHELVRLGAPAEVAEWKDAWVARGTDVLRTVGLDVATAPANDPFFGRGGRVLAASQREQGLKTEILAEISSSEQPTPVMSVNLHLDHFGLDFGIRTADGAVAHTACLGFGLERVTLALFRRHGLDLKSWPRETLAVLGLGERA